MAIRLSTLLAESRQMISRIWPTRSRRQRNSFALGAAEVCETRQLLSATNGADDHVNQISPSAQLIAPESGDSGRIISGILNDAGDTDVFRLELTESSLVDFSTEGIWPSLTVTTPEGVAYSRSDAPAVYDLPEGTSYLHVRSGPEFSQGEYSITAFVATNDDHSNHKRSATFLQPDDDGVFVVDGFLDEGDRDVFRFHLTGAHNVSLSLTADNGEEIQGAFLQSDTVANAVPLNSHEEIQLARGTWYITAYSGPGFDSGSYQLKGQILEEISFGDDDHVDNIGSQATRVEQDTDGVLTMNGVINDSDDRDVFVFDVTEKSMYQLTGDTGFYRIAMKDGTVPRSTAPGMALLDAGTWYLTVGASPVFPHGSYSTRLFPVSDDHDDFVSSATTTIVLNGDSSATITGNLHSRFDLDIIRLEMQTSAVVQFDTGYPEPALSIRDTDGKYIQRSAYPRLYDLQTGVYYLYINNGPEFASGDYVYDLSIAGLLVDDDDDHLNEPGLKATTIVFDANWQGVAAGQFESADDRDVFQFTIDEDRLLRIDNVTETPTSVVPHIELLSEDGNVLLNWSAGQQAITISPGTYFVSVQNATESAGQHSLTVFMDDHSTDGLPVAVNAYGGFRMDGYIGGIDTDGFLIELTEQTSYHFAFQQIRPDVNAPAVIFTLPNGDIVGFDQQQFEVTLPAGQTVARISTSPDFGNSLFHWKAIPSHLKDDHPDHRNIDQPQPTGRLKGRHEIPGDVDIFRVDVSERSDFELTGGGSGNVRILSEDGSVVVPSVDADGINRRLRKGIYYVEVSNALSSGDYELDVAVRSIFDAPVQILSGAGTTFNRRPSFSWQADPDALEYEIYVGLPGAKQATFRTRGLTETSFELPTDLSPDDYEVWVRVHKQGGRMSRWGYGYQLAIGERPAVQLQAGTPDGPIDSVQWTAVDGATEYRVWVDRVNDIGDTLISREVFTTTTNTQFELPEPLWASKFSVWVQALHHTESGILEGRWSSTMSNSPVVYTEPVEILTGAGTTQLTRPEFTWATAGNSDRFELVITTADGEEVFRARNQTGSSLQVPHHMTAGDYKVWLRRHEGRRRMSRWGHGVDLTIQTAVAIGQPVFPVESIGFITFEERATTD